MATETNVSTSRVVVTATDVVSGKVVDVEVKILGSHSFTVQLKGGESKEFFVTNETVIEISEGAL